MRDRLRRLRFWLVALLVVGLGALASPRVVPLYDGVGFPDEPYRYVAPPPGTRPTAAATSASTTTPVVGGLSVDGLTLNTGETGPQLSLFLPLGALAAADGRLAVAVAPLAPTDQPAAATIDGNVYRVTLTASAGGPVTLTAAASVGLLILRATTARQPGPVVHHRSGPGQPWTALPTERGGQDIYSAHLPGAGEYALAFLAAPAAGAGSGGGGGPPVLVVVLGGVLLVLAVVVLVVRRRSSRSARSGT